MKECPYLNIAKRDRKKYEMDPDAGVTFPKGSGCQKCYDSFASMGGDPKCEVYKELKEMEKDIPLPVKPAS